MIVEMYFENWQDAYKWAVPRAKVYERLTGCMHVLRFSYQTIPVPGASPVRLCHVHIFRTNRRLS